MNKTLKRIKTFFIIIFICNILVAIIYYGNRENRLIRSEEMNEQLIYHYMENPTDKLYQKAEETITRPMTVEKSGKKEKYIDLKGMKKTNKDIISWLEIPEIEISYPILQHPEQNDYYLYHNLDGTKGYPGCIYEEKENKKNFQDKMTVLYGHNMKNGSMFGRLTNLLDKRHFEECKYIYVYREDEVIVYKIIAVTEWADLHLKEQYDYKSEKSVNDFLLDVLSKGNGIYRNIEKIKDKRVLVLSTCYTAKKASRLLVIAIEN